MERNIFSEWHSAVNRLSKICASDGPLDLLIEDYLDLLKKCPTQHASFYTKELFRRIAFLHEEAWMLMNGQLVHPFQQIAYKKYIPENGITTFVKKDAERSARWIPRVKHLSICSHDGLLYLNSQRIKKFSEVEKILLDTVRRELDDVLHQLTTFMQNNLLDALKEIPHFKSPEVSMASGLSKIQFKIQKQIGEPKLPDVVVLMQDVIPSSLLYDSILSGEIDHPSGFVPPEGTCTSRAVIVEAKNAKEAEMAKRDAIIQERGKAEREIAANAPKKQKNSSSTSAFKRLLEKQLADFPRPSTIDKKDDEDDDTQISKNLLSVDALQTSSKTGKHEVPGVVIAKRKAGVEQQEQEEQDQEGNNKRPFDFDNEDNNQKSYVSSFVAEMDVEDYSAVNFSFKSGSGSNKKKTVISTSAPSSPVVEEDAELRSSKEVKSTPKKRKTSAYTPTTYVEEVTETLKDKISAHSSQIVSQLPVDDDTGNPIPTDPAALSAWKIKENDKADAKVVSFFLRYVYVTVSLQMQLEDAMIDFVVRKRYIAQCPSEELLEVSNWTELFIDLRKKIAISLDELDEAELEALDLECESRVQRKTEDVRSTERLLESDEGTKEAQFDSLVEINNELIDEYASNVAEEKDIETKRIGVRRKNMNKKVNAALHYLGVKVTFLWAQINNCMEHVPVKVCQEYRKVCYSSEFDLKKPYGHSSRLLSCVKKTKADPREMRRLMVQLSTKDPKNNLKEDFETPRKSLAGSSQQQSVSSTGIGAQVSVTATTPADIAAISSLTQTEMTRFMVDNSNANIISADNIPSTPSASCNSGENNNTLPQNKPPRSLFHVGSVVTSYDHVMKLLLREEAWGKCVDNKLYLALDSTCSKLASITARLKLLQFLLRMLVNGVNDEDLLQQFELHESFKTLHCYFAIKSHKQDCSTIRPDGYCFYRVLYLLYLRCKSEYTLDLAQLCEIDRQINTGVDTPANTAFQEFLGSIRDFQRPMQDGEDPLKNIDQRAFSETVDLVHHYSNQYPGKSIGQDEWGNSIWIRYLTYNISNFTVVSKTDRSSAIAKRLYANSQEHDQWSTLSFTSAGDPTKIGITLANLKAAVANCNFCSFADSHFFLIDSPAVDEATVAISQMTAGFLLKMLNGVRLIQEDYGVLLSNVSSIVLSLENDSICPVTDDFNLNTFRELFVAANPNAPTLNFQMTVVDLMHEGVVAINESAPSTELETFELLKAQVKQLEARVRSYKRLCRDSAAANKTLYTSQIPAEAKE